MAEVKGVWVFNEVLDLPSELIFAYALDNRYNFLVDGAAFEKTSNSGISYTTIYDVESGWVSDRFIDLTPESGSEMDMSATFYEWLVANAVPYEEWIANQKYTIKHGTLTAIGEAIRGKLNTDTQYTPTEMPQAIAEIGDTGGYDQGYTAGQQAEYDRFWDAFQNNGAETNYYQAFQNQFWNDDNFRPKYPITCKGGSTNARNLCYNAQNITNIPVDIIVTGISMQDAFSRCLRLRTIKKIVANGVTSFSGTFTACSKLENITIEGSVDVNFNISATAVLTNESVQSIIDHLKDLTGQTAQKLTFHATVGGKLTDEQKATITAKNWTLVY